MLLHCILYLSIGRNLTYEIPSPAGNQVCGVVVVVVDVDGYVGGVGGGLGLAIIFPCKHY